MPHGGELDQLTGRTLNRGFPVSADPKCRPRAHTVSYIPLKQNDGRKEGVDLFMRKPYITFFCSLLRRNSRTSMQSDWAPHPVRHFFIELDAYESIFCPTISKCRGEKGAPLLIPDDSARFRKCRGPAAPTLPPHKAVSAKLPPEPRAT